MALLGTLINKFGKIAGWNSVKVVMLGRQVEGITALSYKDSKEKDNIYGAGEFPVGRGEGNYKAEASSERRSERLATGTRFGKASHGYRAVRHSGHV